MANPLPLTIVAALARNGALSVDNVVPWRASGDRKRFKEITWGRPLIMGRKTYDATGGPLPGREIVVVSRDELFFCVQPAEHVHPARDFGEALRLANAIARSLDCAEIILAGGEELYARGLPHAKFMRLTRVDSAPRADAFFPAVDWSQWREMRREKALRGPDDDVDYEFVDYART